MLAHPVWIRWDQTWLCTAPLPHHTISVMTARVGVGDLAPIYRRLQFSHVGEITHPGRYGGVLKSLEVRQRPALDLFRGWYGDFWLKTKSHTPVGVCVFSFGLKIRERQTRLISCGMQTANSCRLTSSVISSAYGGWGETYMPLGPCIVKPDKPVVLRTLAVPPGGCYYDINPFGLPCVF